LSGGGSAVGIVYYCSITCLSSSRSGLSGRSSTHFVASVRSVIFLHITLHSILEHGTFLIFTRDGSEQLVHVATFVFMSFELVVIGHPFSLATVEHAQVVESVVFVGARNHLVLGLSKSQVGSNPLGSHSQTVVPLSLR